MSAEEKTVRSPWFTVWLSPRRTIERLVAARPMRLSCSHNDPEFLNHIKRGAAAQVPSLTVVHEVGTPSN